jgi:hypothetical protein
MVKSKMRGPYGVPPGPPVMDMKALEDGNGGWLVRVTYPEGGGFEIHDFSTKAGALTWVMVNRRRLETEYAAVKKT